MTNTMDIKGKSSAIAEDVWDIENSHDVLEMETQIKENSMSINRIKTGSTQRAVVVLLAISLGHTILGTYGYSIGYFYVKLLDIYDEGVIKTSLVGTLNASLNCFIAPFATILMNRYTARFVIVCGALLITTGCLLSAFIKNLNGLIITFGIIAGTGNALAVIPAFVIPGFYFEKHRHFVLSALPVFTGIGMFISTPVAAVFVNAFGLHGAYMMMSGQILQICVIATLCKPSHVENQLIKAYIQKGNDKGMREEKPSLTRKRFSKRNIMIQCSFALFLISTTISNMVFATYQFHLPNYLKIVSFNDSEAVMSVLGIGNTLGRLFSTLIMIGGPNYGIHVYTISLLISGIASILYPYSGQLTSRHYVNASVIGVTTGAPFGVMASTILTILGLQKLSNAFGIAFFFCGVGLFSGPVLTSTLLDIFGYYEIAFILMGCCSLFGSVCALMANRLLGSIQKEDKRRCMNK